MSSTATWQHPLPAGVPAVPDHRPPPAGRAQPVRRRPPLTVVAAGALAVLQSVGLLAAGLTSLDALWGTGIRPPGVVVVGTLLLLAGWVVATAGGGAVLLDGAGSRLLVAVGLGELLLLAVIGVAGLGDGVARATVAGSSLPVPGLALLGAAVPLAKLLLATGVSARDWVAGPRPATRPTRAPVRHPGIRAVTVAGIGLALTAVAVLGSPTPAGSPSATGSATTP